MAGEIMRWLDFIGSSQELAQKNAVMQRFGTSNNSLACMNAARLMIIVARDQNVSAIAGASEQLHAMHVAFVADLISARIVMMHGGIGQGAAFGEAVAAEHAQRYSAEVDAHRRQTEEARRVATASMASIGATEAIRAAADEAALMSAGPPPPMLSGRRIEEAAKAVRARATAISGGDAISGAAISFRRRSGSAAFISGAPLAMSGLSAGLASASESGGGKCSYCYRERHAPETCYLLFPDLAATPGEKAVYVSKGAKLLAELESTAVNGATRTEALIARRRLDVRARMLARMGAASSGGAGPRIAGVLMAAPSAAASSGVGGSRSAAGSMHKSIA